ncbi:MAG: UMP kinase [Clostridiales bacterium]|jgi:uridylate kinase|nr:UMP kinase [Clostridiales bacterium]
MFKRILIKVSGEELAGAAGEPGGAYFDEGAVKKLTSEIKAVTESGTQVSLVTGGGNIWRGRGAGSWMDASRAHQMGMLATVINGVYLSEAFRRECLDSVVMTPFEAGNITERFSKQEALDRMARGQVIILAGGTGLPFFSTDSIAAVRALELEAEALLFAKRVDGVYESDPGKNPQAKKYRSLSYTAVIKNSLRTNGENPVADISALDLLRAGKIVSLVFKLSAPGGIVTANRGEEAVWTIGGTLVKEGTKEEFYVYPQ